MTYKNKLEEWEQGRFAPPPEPDLIPFAPTFTEMVEMRDGVRLYTEVFLPGADGAFGVSKSQFPIILMRSPYPYSRPSRDDKRPLSRYLDEGFGFVFQLTRGQGKSEGTFHMFSDDIDDGFDAVKWVEEQDWCNGAVGMEGSSYVGGTQLLAAKARPPGLKCIMPTAFVGDFTKMFPYCNGVPLRSMFMQWHKVADLDSWDDLDAAYGDINLLKHPKWGPAFSNRPLLDAADEVLEGDKLASWRDCISHPEDDQFWRAIQFTDADLRDLDLPIFFTDGWYDMTIGPIDYFSRLEKLDPDNKDRYLLVGPWNHAQTYSARLHQNDNGDRKMPENAPVDLMALRIAFFKKYLMSQKSTTVQDDRVRIYVTGADTSDANLWLNAPSFPIPGTEDTTLYLHSGGNARSFPSEGWLDESEPGNEKPDIYVYDPHLPTPCDEEDLRDRRHIEIRSDVLSYTTEPFETALTICGEIKLILYAATDCRDTDWFAHVTEVLPDGSSVAFHSTFGTLRARYKDGTDAAKLIHPHEASEFTLSLGPAGHQIAAGHRLRLTIASANFPVFDANTNTGNEVITDVETKVATQTVFHNKARSSRLILPTINLDVWRGRNKGS